ncbi:helix-turn-helix domain-containing protein [Enterococcus diestrammenae]|uniref:helix-turn-helix domain-containing protein n=1 Tax=Enterococcus diestrammenae TaxID=1155073 RepID=UPI001956491A
MESVGERIARLREKRGMSQPQLAKELNVATSTIGMWETGKRGLKDESLRNLADFFNVSTDYLLGRTDDKEKSPTLVAAHLDDNLTEEQLDEVKNFIDFIKQRDHSGK